VGALCVIGEKKGGKKGLQKKKHCRKVDSFKMEQEERLLRLAEEIETALTSHFLRKSSRGNVGEAGTTNKYIKEKGG